MAGNVAHIAFLSPNAAFSAFAESVLANWPDIQVHAFDNGSALKAAAFQPSVIACNFEFDSGFYEGFAPILIGFRRKGHVASLAIVRHFDTWSKAQCRAYGIDEIAIKPISPLHLGLRLAALTTTNGDMSVRHSAEILPFPTRRRADKRPGFHPFAS
jgi:hypothetical protein